MALTWMGVTGGTGVGSSSDPFVMDEQVVRPANTATTKPAPSGSGNAGSNGNAWSYLMSGGNLGEGLTGVASIISALKGNQVAPASNFQVPLAAPQGNNNIWLIIGGILLIVLVGVFLMKKQQQG